MSPKLLHLFGPLYIHAYGLFIALGITAALIILRHDKKLLKIINFDNLLTILSKTIIAGVIGGRLLSVFETINTIDSYTAFLKLWKPGYSILGTLIAAFFTLYFSLKKQNIFPFLVLDRLALYIPLAQAFGRIGCFFTGCCYGITTSVPWAILYTHPDTLAPLHVLLHPTQLYSAAFYIILFITLHFAQSAFRITGQLSGLYMMGASFERFTVDFLRADRTLIGGGFSWLQCVAVGIFCIGYTIFYIAGYAKRKQLKPL